MLPSSSQTMNMTCPIVKWIWMNRQIFQTYTGMTNLQTVFSLRILPLISPYPFPSLSGVKGQGGTLLLA